MTDTATIDQKILASERKFCVYVFLASLAVHLVYLSQYAKSPFFWVLELDPLYHDQLAQSIASGHAPHEAFFRAPLYYYALAGVYALFGHSYWAARIIQAIIGAASCVLTYALGRSIFRPLVGALAAALMVFYGPLVFADGELHTPVLEVFLDLAFLLAARAAWQRRSPVHWLIAGLILGVSAIVRPNILVAILPAVWLVARCDIKIAARLAAAAIFLAGAFLVPGLVTARNAIIGGDPVFIASQGGINFYLGNRPGADGFNPSTPWRYALTGPAYVDSVALFGQKAAEEAKRRTLTQSQAQNYWYGQALDWWEKDPRAALALTAKKLVLAFSRQEIRNNLAFDYVRREWAPALWATFAGFWLIGPLGLIGMALAWRRGPFERFLIALSALYFASFIAFFVADRYRLPMIPILAIFAAYGIVRIGEAVRVREQRALAAMAAAVVAAGLLVNVDWYRTVTPKTWAQDYWSAGLRYMQQHRYPEAEAQVQRALANDPKNAEIWGSLGDAEYESADFAAAGKAYRQAAALDSANASYVYNLALCSEESGQNFEAATLLRRALSLRPNYPDAEKELASLAEHPRLPA